MLDEVLRWAGRGELSHRKKCDPLSSIRYTGARARCGEDSPGRLASPLPQINMPYAGACKDSCVLEKLPEEVVAAGQGWPRALRLVNTLQLDVVLMDITLPGLNELEATKRLVKEQAKKQGQI